jgi:hypothetical protein
MLGINGEQRQPVDNFLSAGNKNETPKKANFYLNPQNINNNHDHPLGINSLRKMN